MKQYIGTKLVQAEPAWRFSNHKGVLAIQPKSDKKALVFEGAYNQEDGYKVRYADGYESWSPEEVFEEAYREVGGMNFGLALEAVKDGFRVARAGWNAPGVYVFLAKAPDFNTDADISEFEDTDVEAGDCLAVRTYQRELQLGWAPSQADLLADDWFLLDDTHFD